MKDITKRGELKKCEGGRMERRTLLLAITGAKGDKHNEFKPHYPCKVHHDKRNSNTELMKATEAATESNNFATMHRILKSVILNGRLPIYEDELLKEMEHFSAILTLLLWIRQRNHLHH